MTAHAANHATAMHKRRRSFLWGGLMTVCLSAPWLIVQLNHLWAPVRLNYDRRITISEKAERATSKVHVKNATNQPVTINGYSASCGCLRLVTDLPLLVEPGEHAELEFVFLRKRGGLYRQVQTRLFVDRKSEPVVCEWSVLQEPVAAAR